MHLLGRLPVGERLVYLLRVASAPADPLAEDALEAATKVLLRPNLGYVRLAAAEAAAIEQELEGLGPRLDPSARRHLLLLLRACSGAGRSPPALG